MKSRKDILDYEKRKKIYELILKNPGLHLRELSRILDIPMGSLRFHLNSLKKHDLITTKKIGRFKRYYAIYMVSNKDKEILNLLRQEIPRRIIILLLTAGPGDIYKDKETQKKAYLKKSTFTFTYSKKELIELTKYWNGIYANFFHLHRHRTTVAFHLKKLLAADIIEQVKIGRVTKYKLKDEDIIMEYLLKYKDALSTKSIDVYLDWCEDSFSDNLQKIENVIFEIFPHPYYN